VRCRPLGSEYPQPGRKTRSSPRKAPRRPGAETHTLATPLAVAQEALGLVTWIWDPRGDRVRWFGDGRTAELSGVVRELNVTLERRVAQRHGGTVAVESEPGRGATFRYTLPV